MSVTTKGSLYMYIILKITLQIMLRARLEPTILV